MIEQGYQPKLFDIPTEEVAIIVTLTPKQFEKLIREASCPIKAWQEAVLSDNPPMPTIYRLR